MDDDLEESDMPLPPFPINDEFNMMRERYYQKDGTDRKKWEQKINFMAPEIQEFRESVLPVERSIKFGRMYLPDDKYLSATTTLSLISQHLQILGLSNTRKTLQNEWIEDLDFPDNLSTSQLANVVQNGLYRADQFFDASIPGSTSTKLRKQQVSRLSKLYLGASSSIDNCAALSSEEFGSAENLQFKVEQIDGIERKIISYASLNQIIWVCTTKNVYLCDDKETEEFVQVICRAILMVTTPQSVYQRCKERFDIALNEVEQSMTTSIQMLWNFICTFLFHNQTEMAQNIKSDFHMLILKMKNMFPDCCSYFLDIFNPPPQIVVNELLAPKVKLLSHIPIWSNDFNLLALPASELARQITIWTAKKFSLITKNEFFNKSRTDEDLQILAPNIYKFEKIFDSFSSWALKTMESPPKGFDTNTIILYFGKLSKKLFEYCNFQMCSSIICAFKSSNQLGKQIQEMFDKRKKFQTFYSEAKSKIPLDFSQSSINNTRAFCLKALNEEGKPVIPTFYTWMNLLSRLQRSYNLTSEGLVYYTLLDQLAQIIKELGDFQYGAQKYNFFEVDQVQTLLDKAF